MEYQTKQKLIRCKNTSSFRLLKLLHIKMFKRDTDLTPSGLKYVTETDICNNFRERKTHSLEE